MAFSGWLNSESLAPYGSFGNGSAMRVSPIGFAFTTLDTVLEEAKKSAEVTHDHPEGIKGAQAVASAIYLARSGYSKDAIRNYIEETYDYDLNRSIDAIRPDYSFNETCQGSVPESIIAFMESSDYEDAVRKAISLGGDSDTMACIAGGIAQAYYKVIPRYIIDKIEEILDNKLLQIIDKFIERYGL
jgi:ADP-ribosylglycohydrolase